MSAKTTESRGEPVHLVQDDKNPLGESVLELFKDIQKATGEGPAADILGEQTTGLPEPTRRRVLEVFANLPKDAARRAVEIFKGSREAGPQARRDTG